MKPSFKTIDGLRISFDTMDFGYTPEEHELQDELYEVINMRGGRRHLPRLKKAVEQYPNNPIFKNFLYNLYLNTGQQKKAREVLESIRREHPDYVMGKINQAVAAVTEGRLEAAAEALHGFDLKKVAGQREELHFSEVLKFWSAAALYHLRLENLEQAEHYFGLMEDLDEGSRQGEIIAQGIVLKRMQLGLARMREEQELERLVDSFPTYSVPKSKKPPALPHPELEQLYQYSDENMPGKVIREILRLPRESLRAGLRMILEDSYRRHDYFTKKYKKQWEPNKLSFPIHALFFLREVGEAEDLDALLNLYRQGHKILSYWFGDMFDELNWYTIYELGQNQLEKLKAFVLEPNLYFDIRLTVCKALAQLAIHQPARRQEVLDWFRDVFQYHLGHPGDEKRIDTAFLSWSAYEALKIRAKELWPLIEQMYQQGFILPHYIGELGKLQESMEQPFEEHHKNPLPRDIFEHYRGGHHSRRARPAPDPELEALLNDKKQDKFISAFSRLLGINEEEPEEEEEEEEEEPAHWIPPQTIKSTKVGRNEPCPCGSGKKYKKCCGRA